MPQTITKGFREMLEEAEREVESLSVEDARKLYGRDDVTFVDIRDPREREREGKIPGAFSCTRGMLEFWIDPASPYQSRSSPKTRSSCSSAPAAGAHCSLRRPRKRWG